MFYRVLKILNCVIEGKISNGLQFFLLLVKCKRYIDFKPMSYIAIQQGNWHQRLTLMKTSKSKQVEGCREKGSHNLHRSRNKPKQRQKATNKAATNKRKKMEDPAA